MVEVHVIGVGLHPFGRHVGKSGLQLGILAARRALDDAGMSWHDVEFGYGGSVAAGSADAVLPALGLTGIPFINVANGCATGGSALLASFLAIKSGHYDVGLVLGFDSHPAGAFNFSPTDSGLPEWYGKVGMMLTTQYFSMKIMRYSASFGISQVALARVAEKAFHNGSLAPHAWRRQPKTVTEILESPMVSDPLTKFMFCSPAEGAAAVVLVSDRKLRQLGARGPRIRSVVVRTRGEGSFEVFSPSILPEQPLSPTRMAATAAYEMAGVAPADIDVAQVQDTDSGAEIIHMAENGFCKDGDQEDMLRAGTTKLGGQLPINTDGGCLACGEPIGASGLRQVVENVLQLRGQASNRQVRDARLAYAQVYGMPGLSAVSILEAM